MSLKSTTPPSAVPKAVTWLLAATAGTPAAGSAAVRQTRPMVPRTATTKAAATAESRVDAPLSSSDTAANGNVAMEATTIVPVTMAIGSVPSSTASWAKRIESTSSAMKPTATTIATQPISVASSELTAAWVMPITAANDDPMAAAAARPPTRSRTSTATAGMHARAKPATGPSRLRNMVPAATIPAPAATIAAIPVRVSRT